MSTGWSGPWLSAVDAAGRSTSLAGDAWRTGRLSLPVGTARVMVRWREPGHSNPRKRTLLAGDRDEILRFARHIAAAALTGEPGRALSEPPAGRRPAAATPNDHSRTLHGQHPDNTGRNSRRAGDAGCMPTSPTAPSATDTRIQVPAQTRSQPALVPTFELPIEVAPVRAVAPASAPPGPTVEQFKDRLLLDFGPGWRDRRDDSTPLQLELACRVFVYRDGDPLLDQYPGLSVGDSIHLSVLTDGHCADALLHRRCVNYQAQHNNQVKRESYAKKLAEYERKIAAYEAGTGHRGRKPAPPTPPNYALASCTVEEGADLPLISERTEELFVVSSGFLFDRASDRGLMPQGNAHKRWRRADQPGQRGTKPYRRPTPLAAAGRTLPGFGFLVDLGDALTGFGRVVSDDGRRTGERYRYAACMVGWRLMRPGEAAMARPEHCDGREHTMTAESGQHLKLRKPGVTREMPVSGLDYAFQQAHVDAGYTSDTGQLFSSPHGYRLDLSNFKDDFLGPAMRRLLLPGGLWADAGDAMDGIEWDLYLLRKIGISVWLAHGLEPSYAAQYAGHDEKTQNDYYKGVIRGARSRLWVDIDTAVVAALVEHPPRGEGELAKLVRSWLPL